MSVSSPIKIIVNSVAYSAAEIRITNGSDAEQTSEYDTRFNIVAGQRYHKHTQSGTGTRRYVYINKTNTFSADTCILTDASAHLTHDVRLYSWTDYTTTIDSAIFSNSNFAETLLGRDSTDWLYSFSQRTSKQAFGLELQSGTGGAYTKKVGKLFFGNAFSLYYPEALSHEFIDQKIVINNQIFYCRDAYRLTFTALTQSEIETFNSLSNIFIEPVFIYDAGGNWIPEKLLYGIIPNAPSIQQYDDLHALSIDFFEIRRS